MCTTKKKRGEARGTWDTEMEELIQYIKINRLHSDAALYYDWRHTNYIVSMGRLADYVKELRTVKEVIRRQVIQKPIIDAIKSLRVEVSKNPELCATAVREIARSKDYIYPKKKFAIAEMERLGKLVEDMWKAQDPALRLQCKTACPLRHAMPVIGDNLDRVRGAGMGAGGGQRDNKTTKERDAIPEVEEIEDDDFDVASKKVDVTTGGIGGSPMKGGGGEESTDSNKAKMDAEAQALMEEEGGWPVPTCKVCQTTEVSE